MGVLSSVNYNDFAPPMPAITINNLSDELYERIKISAKAHHRTIDGESIAILEQALIVRRPNPAAELARIRELRTSLGLPNLDPKEIRAAISIGLSPDTPDPTESP